ncbi:hypothetical protein GOODEAATRI_031634, partial [Goodea atripinnis]
DTVEYYELYYRPVLEEMPADNTCAPQGMIFFRMAAGLPCNDYTIYLQIWRSSVFLNFILTGNTNPVDSYTVELSEMGTVGTESNIT